MKSVDPVSALRIGTAVATFVVLGGLVGGGLGLRALWTSWTEEADRQLLEIGRGLLDSSTPVTMTPPNGSLSGDAAEVHVISLTTADGREIIHDSKWPQEAVAALREGGEFRTRSTDGRSWRVMGLRNSGGDLRLAMSLAPVREEAAHFLNQAASLVSGAAVSLGIAVFLAAQNRARRRQEQSERTERTATAAAMRFDAEAAHELRTPLAALQARIGVALAKPEMNDSEAVLLADLSQEVRRIREITDALLLLGKADAGTLRPFGNEINFSAMIESLVVDAAAEATDLKIDLTCSIPPGVMVTGDEKLLRIAVSNLIRNAYAYNFPDGFVKCELCADGGSVQFRIQNSGPPILPPDAGNLFGRFQRGTSARSSGRPGHGLGLTLALAVIRSHGGELKLERSDENGTVFLLTLPAGDSGKNVI